MALEVIGAGFGRTGTLTLKLALEFLGFGPCHHMTEIFDHPEQADLWNRIAEGEAIEWDSVFDGYRATVDWPACHFFAELASRYPKAKVILSERDPARWLDSMSRTILPSIQEGLAAPVDAATDPGRFTRIIIAERTFGMDFREANVLAAYERHNAKVRRSIPAERLLPFQPADGWKPLCAFLGVSVPDAPFPRSNAEEEFWVHTKKWTDIRTQ